MCVVNRAQSLPPTVSPHRHHPLLFSVLRDSIHSRDLGNPANELSPTISPYREDHPPPFRGWRGTKAGLLGIRNSLDRRQGDLYKGTIPRRNHSSLRDSIHSRDLGNPANELSPTISPHREDHPPPFRGWRGTKSGLLGIRNSLNRRQGDLYKGTIPR